MNNIEIIDSEKLNKVYNNIIKNTCGYLKENPNIKSLILGISGGIDSAVVAILAKEVINFMKRDFYGNRDIKLIGRSLPIITNTIDEIKRANHLGSLICDEFDTINLKEAYNSLSNTLSFEKNLSSETKHSTAVRFGNLKARIRMIYLYNLAQMNKGMVLSTDNYTEYLLGFWTLHGDVGDFGMIQNLWKTEVYMLAEHFISSFQFNELKELVYALKDCSDAIPTDGLGITKSDFDQFGDINSYEEIDKILIDMLNNGYSKYIKERKIPKVLTLCERTKFKRENPFNISRELLLKK